MNNILAIAIVFALGYFVVVSVIDIVKVIRERKKNKENAEDSKTDTIEKKS